MEPARDLADPGEINFDVRLTELRFSVESKWPCSRRSNQGGDYFFFFFAAFFVAKTLTPLHLF